MSSTQKDIGPMLYEHDSLELEESSHATRRKHKFHLGLQILVVALIATASIVAARPVLSNFMTAQPATSSIESTPSSGNQATNEITATVSDSPEVAPLPPESLVASESPDPSGIEVEVSKRRGVLPGIDRISVRNHTAATLDVSNWRIEPAIGSDVFTVPEGTAIKSGQTLTIYEMNIIGEQCRADTALALFTCNALGLKENTRDVIFRFASVRVVDESGTVVAVSE